MRPKRLQIYDGVTRPSSPEQQRYGSLPIRWGKRHIINDLPRMTLLNQSNSRGRFGFRPYNKRPAQTLLSGDQ
jgi:hypothetical protein